MQTLQKPVFNGIFVYPDQKLIYSLKLTCLIRTPFYRVFSHDVTAAILVSQNNEMAAMLVSQTNHVAVELCSYANVFFCTNRFAQMLAT